MLCLEYFAVGNTALYMQFLFIGQEEYMLISLYDSAIGDCNSCSSASMSMFMLPVTSIQSARIDDDSGDGSGGWL